MSAASVPVGEVRVACAKGAAWAALAAWARAAHAAGPAAQGAFDAGSVAIVAAFSWRLRVERAAGLAAERTPAESRVARAAAEARRARHCAALGREASASLEALNGAMRLLDAARLEPGVRLHLAALRRAASGLAAQLAHAIDYDAIERGEVRVRPQRTEVLALVREVASQSAAEAADRRVAFALFAPQHPIPGMVVDPSRLRQVADALVCDAIERTRDREVRVELCWECEAAGSGQGWLTLNVTDDGPDPAPRAAARTQAALDGDVPVPARDVGDIDAEAVVGVATRGALLLVEDDRVVQFTLAQQLSRLGYDVVCADDAEEAIETWLRAPTRYVMTDLGLPGRDGVALIAAIRDAERARGWPPSWIVVLTGEPAHEGRSRQAGADRVLLKPATGDEMARALEAGAVTVRATRPTAAD
jgi:CheY-like chemotaxis protein